MDSKLQGEVQDIHLDISELIKLGPSETQEVPTVPKIKTLEIVKLTEDIPKVNGDATASSILVLSFETTTTNICRCLVRY